VSLHQTTGRQRKHNYGNRTVTVVTEFGGTPKESRKITDPVNQDIWLRLARAAFEPFTFHNFTVNSQNVPFFS
jgi:hypothetical protein